MSMASGRLLGLGCGQVAGSAEILLKAALMAAEESGAEVELIRLDDLRIPSGPDASEPDDAWWFWEKLIEADALIISTPIISRTVAARLKLLGDRLLGPNADAAIIEELVRIRREGGAPAVPFRVDERVLRPRVAGFIAVGGSLTSQWKTLTLPIMHTTTFSMQIAVADQVQFEGAGTPRSITLDAPALERAARLGRNVAEQIGREFADVEYRGDDHGLCPMCHLNVIVLRGRDVECATCGARGELVVSGNEVAVRFSDEGCLTSVISMHEKREHFFEIQETASRHAEQREEIEARAGVYDAYDRLVRPERAAINP
jgi:multimeric flavodoxin WrbA